MNTFEASNGIVVRSSDTGVYMDKVEAGTRLYPAEAHALREFFQRERDEELGRWRWPEHPEYVVYAGRSPILILNELTGDTLRARPEDGHTDTGHGTIYNAAAAYFEAHPERKPWEGAKPGEVWAVTYDGTEGVFIHAGHNGGAWYGQGDMRVCLDHPLSDPNITDARRIWPESD